MDFDKTMNFTVEKDKNIKAREILKKVYNALQEKGYNPIIIAEQQLIDSLSNIKYISVGSTDDEIMRNIFARAFNRKMERM